MIDYETQHRVLHSPFDLETHKATFVNYTEVVIDPEGTIHYAVPSHTCFLENYCCKMYHISRSELSARVPREYWCDMNAFLMKMSGCMLVWNCGYDYYEAMTDKQKSAVDSLIASNLISDVDMCQRREDAKARTMKIISASWGWG